MASIDRRRFVQGAAVGAGLALARGAAAVAEESAPPKRPAYDGPNVIIVRFGGGVRRRETIDADHTCAPFFLKRLAAQGTLYTNMQISASFVDKAGRERPIASSHGEGTLNILTGTYDEYQGVSHKHPDEYDWKLFDGRFEASVPTVFEYLRKSYDIPAHQTLTINSEDRTDEEFYSFSNHHLFGAKYRCNTLSLYRFKVYLLRRQIDAGAFTGAELRRKQAELAKLESIDFRKDETDDQGRAIAAFWRRWREHYGETGFVNPRGDRLLTELAVRAIRELRPRLMMINYTDPDYVHWGNLSHYTRGIAVIDQGLQRLTDVCRLEERYRDNTIFVIVPDCGRDNNRAMRVPCQHHFNSRSARQIFALLVGPGVERGVVVDKAVEQIAVAPTIGRLMRFDTPLAQGEVLPEALA